MLQYSLGAIARAHKNARHDLHKPSFQPPLPIAFEFFWRHETFHPQVVLSRLQVLSQCEDINIVRTKIIHALLQFCLALAQTEHQ